MIERFHRMSRFETCPHFYAWKAIPSETSVTGHEVSGIYMIVEHIYEEGKLEEDSTCRKFRQVQTEGNRQVERE